MTQVPAHFEMNDAAGESTEKPPFSVAAITSLVFSLLFCIPGMAVLGLLLGVIGIFTTGGGARRGRGLAIAGMLLSFMVGAIWVIGIMSITPWISGTLKFALTGPRDTMTAIFDGEMAVAQKHFLTRSRPTEQELTQFADSARARWGDYKKMSIKDPQNAGEPEIPIPIDVTFESGVVPGVVVFSAGEDKSGVGDPSDIVFMQSDNDFHSFILIDSIMLQPATGESLSLGSPLASGAPGSATKSDGDEASGDQEASKGDEDGVKDADS